VRTFKRRLAQGRHGLRARLARRGIALPALLLTLGLTHKGRAALPATWVAATVRAALGAGTGTAPVVAEAVLRGMSAARLKAVAALLLMGTLILGAGALARQAQDRRPDTAPPAPAPVAAIPRPEPPPAQPPAGAEDTKTTAVIGRVLDAYGNPVPDARVTAYGLLNFGTLSRQHQEKALGEVRPTPRAASG
jgi:hypothetical protein